MAKPLPVGTLRFLCLGLHSEFGIAATLADLAVAGLSMTLKFPAGDYLSIPSDLKGKGIPGLADNSAYEPFFAWRDRLYSTYRKSSASASTGTSNPTVIDIE